MGGFDVGHMGLPLPLYLVFFRLRFVRITVAISARRRHIPYIPWCPRLSHIFEVESVFTHGTKNHKKNVSYQTLIVC